MGGRGANSNLIPRREPQGRNGKISIDSDLIRRADEASLLDMGKNINNEFQRNIKEIAGLTLSQQEKDAAINRQKELAIEALKLQSKAVNPYVSGPARLTPAQRTGSAAQQVADKRAEITRHMNDLRNRSNQNNRAEADKRLFSAMQSAIANKKLSFTINGQTYTRKNLRGRTFTLERR